MDLKTDLKTTEKFVQTLNLYGIRTLKDFFYNFPRTHEDRQDIKTISNVLLDGSVQTLKVKVIKKSIIRTAKGKTLGEVHFEDIDGIKGKAGFLNSTFGIRNVFEGSRYNVIGKPKIDKGKLIMRYPQFVPAQAEEISSDEEFKTGRIYPIYSEMGGISSVWFAKKAWQNLDKIEGIFEEYLPQNFLEKYGLMGIKDTIKNMHYPESFELLSKAKYRFFFEKLLKLQLISMMNKQDYEQSFQKSIGEPDREIIKDFQTHIPFELTNAQKKSIKNIIDDFYKIEPMMRLLQGDVGSGKTVVALAGAFYIKQKFGGQTVILAPTEVLATQHIKSLSKILLPLGIRLELLTGSVSAAQKQKIKSDLKLGKIDVLIGTHAILQEDVDFENLRFVVIDEQHKFGVMQRAFFKKFDSPHILQMSATPIPRSLALAFFGEFEVSVIDEMPAGRKPITTKIISEAEFKKMKTWILNKISQGEQIYLITPLVEDSEKMDELSSAVTEFEQISGFLPELKGQIGLLHGRLKSSDKDDVMNDFKSGKLKFLVSTTVIEVGIDVPQATIIIIKNSERFGLSQLHQLRGRVGRSDLQSYCFLISKSKSGDTYQRLKAMEDTNDGFKLAQIDMQLRGSGEILGTRQSGETDLPVEILTDIKLIEKVKNSALRLLEKYPELKGLDKLKAKILGDDYEVLI